MYNEFDKLSKSVDAEKMTSIQISEITGKPHSDLMKSIRSMEPSWEKVNGLKFELVKYKDSKGELRPCYSLTKTECLYIATKFNDEARAKLVLRWEELEKENLNKKMYGGFSIPKTYLEALELAVQQQRKIEGLEIKAKTLDDITASDKLVDIGQAAKILGLDFGRNTLFAYLRIKGIMFKNRNEPKQFYVNKGYFKVKEDWIKDSNYERGGYPIVKVYVTQKGIEFLSKLNLNDDSIKDLTEIRGKF